jgi:hypothetical protein
MSSTRAFSVLSRVRALARAAEAHPFQRYPVTQKPAPADWNTHIQRVAGTALA